MALTPVSAGLAFGSLAARRPVVTRLVLHDLRSYATLDLPLDGRPVVLSGENGAGKTNLLEALSLLTPGRGLRRAEARDIARREGAGGWAVAATVREDEAERRLGTGLDAADPAGASPTRRFRIDGAPAPSARAFADHLRVVWLTPAMDPLFAGPASERRRFLDRVVLTLDADHAGRVAALERALRNRNRLLDEARTGTLDRAWADAAEREVAALGIAVAAARADAVTRLQAMIATTRDDASAFPWAALAVQGPLEELLVALPAVAAEDRYREMLRANRARDTAAGRTTVGAHLSDLAVRHGPKDIPAEAASTGEQKALVVGLVLAQAQLVTAMSGIAPLMLLDEVPAHFDPRRRRALFEALGRLGGHVFMTGADPAAFADMPEAERFTVTPGRVEPAA